MLKKKFSKVLASILVASSLLVGCSSTETKQDISTGNIEQNQVVTNTQDNTQNEGNSKVHFIDTGNSDSILIENNGEFMLIDGGDTDDDDTVNNYLNKIGVKELKYVLATHPHADHIGALDTVVLNFDVDNLFIGSGKATTKAYKMLLSNASSKGITPTVPNEDSAYTLGNGILKFYNTKGVGSSNLNDSSVILKYTNGNDDFLFTGDAEYKVELKYKDVFGDIDVLKAGHHGSSSSSNRDFIEAIAPEHVLLLTGENSYGHPHKEVVDLFKELNIPVYRSDESGDIIVTSSGNGVTFNTEPDSYNSGSSISNTSSDNYYNTTSKEPVIENTTDSKDTSNNTNTITSNNSTYYFTPNGKSYHTTKDCSTLSRSKTILSGTLDEAIAQGKSDSCDKCN